MFKETALSQNKTIIFQSYHSFEQLRILEFKTELSVFDSLDQLAESVVIFGLITSFIIGSYFKSSLYTYLHKSYKTFGFQPINALILIQAISQHTVCILMVANYTIGLYFDVTFSDHLGESWCNIPWYTQAYGAGFRNFGSLGIAIFRLFLIKNNDWVKYKFGLKRLLVSVISCSIIASVLFAIGFGTGNGPGSRKQVTWNFCTGKSEVFREIEEKYELHTGTATNESEVVAELAVVFSLISAGLELLCYILFFQHLDNHDKEMLKRNVLSTGEVKRRRNRNAISFMGQFYGFGVEIVVYFGLLFTLRETSKIGYRLGLELCFWIEFGLVSVVEVMSSNNLRNYLPHKLLYH